MIKKKKSKVKKNVVYDCGGCYLEFLRYLYFEKSILVIFTTLIFLLLRVHHLSYLLCKEKQASLYLKLKETTRSYCK